MTVSQLVVKLADLIEHSSLRRSPAQQQLITHLKAIPDYLARGRLDEWEADFPDESSEDDPATSALLEAIEELGTHNLYTLFK